MSRCCSYTADLKNSILCDIELGKCGLCCHSENCVSGFEENIPQKPSGKIDSVIWMLISRCSEALVSFYTPTSDLRKKQRSFLFVIHSFQYCSEASLSATDVPACFSQHITGIIKSRTMRWTGMQHE